MPNGRFWPLTKISRSCAPPVCPGSRITMISPDPMSARKMSPFGAIVSHRGRWKFFANIFTRNPCGTVGKNPGGGRSEEHTSELQSHSDLVCRLLLEKKKKKK